MYFSIQLIDTPTHAYYSTHVIEIHQTEVFAKWLRKLGDHQAKARITIRIRHIELTGNFGDVKSIGEGVSEVRITYGPGYRLYYTMTGETVLLLLCGGDKSTQSQDIEKAKEVLHAQ